MVKPLLISAQRLAIANKVLCLWVALLAIFGMAFWLVGDVPGLDFIAVRMKFNAAINLLLLAVSLCAVHNLPVSFIRRNISLVLSGIALMFSGAILFQYFAPVNFGVDELFAKDPIALAKGLAPGRVAPNTVICFIFLALSVMLTNSEKPRAIWVAQKLALATGALALVALVGYAFEADPLYRIGSFVRISPFTAFGIWLLSIGVFLARPHHGLQFLLTDNNAGGKLTRQLLIAALVLPTLFGFLGLTAFQDGLASPEVTFAAVTVAVTLLLSGMVWRSASLMHTSDSRRRESEARLSDEKQKLQAIIANLPLGLVITDGEGKLVLANDQVNEILGRKSTDVASTLQGYSESIAFDIVTGKPLGHNERPTMRSALQGEILRNYEIGIRTPTGPDVLVNVNSVPVRNEKNEIEYAVTVFSDITERKRLETEVTSARDAAERANVAKTQFLANMSHEIRTPLGAIVGFIELMKNADNTRADNLDYMSVINRNSQQLLRLIDDILDLSKVEAGKMTIEAVRISLRDFLNDFSAVMRFRAREKGIQFTAQFQSLLPEFISTDPVRLRQILSNLAGNAIKFTDVGSVNMVVTADANSVLTFTFRDTGCGMTSAQTHGLFQPFTQADASTTRKFGGTGLGLSLSKRLAQAMGGDVTLEDSAPGSGSVFKAVIRSQTSDGVRFIAPEDFALPALTEKADDGKAHPLAGVRVLVVEDSPDNQVLVTKFLRKAGATVDLANDGLEGIAKAKTDKFDVVLMDIQMPNLDGLEATKRLRAEGYNRPIVALTAHAMLEERLKCMAAGCSDHLAKPLQRDALISVIAKHTARHPGAALPVM